MKKYVILLLISLMLIGLTLSVFAAETASPAHKSEDGPRIASAPLFDENPAALSVARKIVSGACGLVLLYAQLGCGLLGAGSRAKTITAALALNIVSCSIGMLREQFRSLLAGLLILRKEQKGVCYGW